MANNNREAMKSVEKVLTSAVNRVLSKMGRSAPNLATTSTNHSPVSSGDDFVTPRLSHTSGRVCKSTDSTAQCSSRSSDCSSSK